MERYTEDALIKGEVVSMETYMKIVEQLSYFLEKRDQGLLLELPCDIVYRIVDEMSPKWACAMGSDIQSLRIYEIQNMKKYGIYTTKEEAQKRVAEIKAKAGLEK